LIIQLRFEIDRLGRQVQALEADRAAIVEALLSTGVEPASDDPMQLAAQVRELVRQLRLDLSTVWREMCEDDEIIIALTAALREILVEATGDFDRGVILTAARDALEGVK